MSSLAKSLNEYNIQTTKIWISKAKRRNKDNEETSVVAFGIRRAYVDKFIKDIGWLK